MEITMNVDYLLKNKISANEFLVLQMLLEKQDNRLIAFIKVIGEDEYHKITTSLENMNFLEQVPVSTEETLNGSIVTHLVQTTEYRVTETALRTFKGKGYFEEFYMAYPVSVVRPDGKRESLRTDKKRSQTKYNRLAKRKDVHEHIMKCLEYEVKERTQNNSLMYMKKMPNWLGSETWREYEEKIKIDSLIDTIKEELDDGTKLL
jgi:hypothetical protein